MICAGSRGQDRATAVTATVATTVAMPSEVRRVPCVCRLDSLISAHVGRFNQELSIPGRTIDVDEMAFLEGMARWMDANGEGIFGARP